MSGPQRGTLNTMPALIAQHGLLIVVLIIFFGEIGFPTLVPGEIAILLAGAQVVHSIPVLIGVCALFGAVDILACSTIHVASRTCGNRLLVRLLRHLQSNRKRHEEIIEGWRRKLRGCDALVVFVTRLIPMFRLYASISTGLIRIRFRHFVAGAVPASLVWASTPLIVGYTQRTRVAAVQAHFPALINIVIICTVVILVGTAAAAWVRNAGSHAAGLRRLRFALGLGAVGGALVRLVLVALNVDRVFSYASAVSSAQVISLWVTILSLVALTLLWIAARDLGAIRRHHRNIGAVSVVAWVSLMLMFGGLNTVAAVSPAAIFG